MVRDTPEDDGADARIFAPAAARNRAAIAEQIQRFAPQNGRALEIASGTGEHVVHLAPLTPGLTWQPTDIAADRLASIAAWQAQHPSANMRAPQILDATQPGWGARHAPADLVLLVNLLHLISDIAARAVLGGIAEALAPGGRGVIYGPFLRDGRATSPGDAAFDARLRADDPDTGYKDIAWVLAILSEAGLTHLATVDMPANNLLLVLQRPWPR